MEKDFKSIPDRAILGLAMYPLYYLDDNIEDPKAYTTLNLDWLIGENKVKAERISEVIDKALSKDDFDFTAAMPGMDRYQNEHIRSWLINVNDRIKRELLEEI